MTPEIPVITESYLRDKGLVDKESRERVNNLLLELLTTIVERLEETGASADNIVHLRNSGGIEIYKTSEARALGRNESHSQDR